jgi:hypothetical protein
VPSQSASTFTTTSVTTRSVTPIDPLTTVLDDGNLIHQAETGNDGSRFFDTPEASYQKENRKDDDEASGRVSGVPPQLPTTSSATHPSTTIAAPIQSRTADPQDTTADQPSEIDYNTLFLLNNTINHTTSRDNTSQRPGETHWFQLFQNRDAAPFSEQQYAEDWDFTPALEPPSAAPTASMNLSSNNDFVSSDVSSTVMSHLQMGQAYSETTHAATSHYRPFGGYVYNPYRSLGRRRFNVDDDNNGWTSLSHAMTSRYPRPRYARPASFNFDTDDSVPQSSSSEPERKPSSKVKVLFSKLKAYIKAPFRRHR